MARKSKTAEDATPALTDAEIADKVREARKAKREAKAAAAAERKALQKKPVMGPATTGRMNSFGIAASTAKATSFSRSIISRARGGRGR